MGEQIEKAIDGKRKIDDDNADKICVVKVAKILNWAFQFPVEVANDPMMNRAKRDRVLAEDLVHAKKLRLDLAQQKIGLDNAMKRHNDAAVAERKSKRRSQASRITVSS